MRTDDEVVETRPTDAPDVIDLEEPEEADEEVAGPVVAEQHGSKVGHDGINCGQCDRVCCERSREVLHLHGDHVETKHADDPNCCHGDLIDQDLGLDKVVSYVLATLESDWIRLFS